MVVSPRRVVVTCSSDSWVSIEQLLEQMSNGTISFLVWFCGVCSVATTWFCGWAPLDGNVWLATVVFAVHLSILYFRVVISIIYVVLICKCLGGLLLHNLGNWWMGGCFDVLIVSGLSYAAPKLRCGVSSLTFGLQIEHSHVNYFGISLFDLILSFRPSVPGRRSISCVCSKVAFLCGMVNFTTGLIGLVSKSRFSVFLIFCIVCNGIVGNFFWSLTLSDH